MGVYAKLFGAGSGKDGATPPSRFSRAPRYARQLAGKDKRTGYVRPTLSRSGTTVQTGVNARPVYELKKAPSPPKKMLSAEDGGVFGGLSRTLAGVRSLLSPAQQTATVPTYSPTLPDGTAYSVDPSTGGGIFGRLFGGGDVPSSFAGPGVEPTGEGLDGGFPTWAMIAAALVIGWLIWRARK